MSVKFSTQNTSQIKRKRLFQLLNPIYQHITPFGSFRQNTFRVYNRLLTNQLRCLGTDVLLFARFRRDRISFQWAIATNFQRSWHTIEISKAGHSTQTDSRAECSNIESVSTTSCRCVATDEKIPCFRFPLESWELDFYRSLCGCGIDGELFLIV